MHNMQNMSNNMLQYAKQYVKYAKLDVTICQKIVPCSDSAYFAYCNMNNMQNMSDNILQYAKQYAKYGKEYAGK
jgi:hypothetical protein